LQYWAGVKRKFTKDKLVNAQKRVLRYWAGAKEKWPVHDSVNIILPHHKWSGGFPQFLIK